MHDGITDEQLAKIVRDLAGRYVYAMERDPRGHEGAWLVLSPRPPVDEDADYAGAVDHAERHAVCVLEERKVGYLDALAPLLEAPRLATELVRARARIAADAKALDGARAIADTLREERDANERVALRLANERDDERRKVARLTRALVAAGVPDGIVQMIAEG